MSAVAPEPAAPTPGGLAPRAIRSALPPEEVGDFDRGYRHAMAEATDSLDLTPVLDLLRRWRRVAWSSQDPQAHRTMLAHAEQLAAGVDLPTEPWHETKARLGL